MLLMQLFILTQIGGTRLRVCEIKVEEQRAAIKELKEKQEEQAAAVRAVGGSVNLTGSQVEELRTLFKCSTQKNRMMADFIQFSGNYIEIHRKSLLIISNQIK